MEVVQVVVIPHRTKAPHHQAVVVVEATDVALPAVVAVVEEIKT
jgi:hypothetical protein